MLTLTLTLSLALDMARARGRDLMATLVALTLGMGVSTAALMVTSSARPGVPASFADTAAVVRAAADGVDGEDFAEYRPWDAATADRLADRVRALPEVLDAVPVRTFYAQLVPAGRPAGTPSTDDPEGRSWSTASLAPYRLSAGRPPAAADEIAVSDGYPVAAGDRVPLLTAQGRREVLVTGIVDGPGIYLSDGEARLLGGGTTLIGVLARPGHDAEAVAEGIRPLAGSGVTVMTGESRSGAEPEGATRTRYLGTQLLTMMLVLACFAAVLVVSQTFALAASHRRRDVALLRTLGGTPRQVQAITLIEAAAVGILGSVLGVILGAFLAPWLGQALVRAGLEPVGFEVVVDAAVPAAVLVLGPTIAVVATWATGRRSGRVSPLDALRDPQPDDRRPGRWRLLSGIGAAVAAAGAGLAATVAEAHRISGLATAATLLTIAAISCLAPVLLPPLVRLVTLPLDRGPGAIGMLVRGSMTAAIGRTAATMTPVLATIAFATLVLGYVETGRAAYGGDGVPAGATAVVAPDGTPGLSEDTVALIQRLAGPGVADTLATQVFAGRTGATPALGLRSVAPGTAVPARSTAAANGWRVGDVVEVTLPDGARQALRIAAVAPAGGGADGGADGGIALPRSLVREHDGSALTRRLVLTGPTPDDVAGVVRPGVRALTAAGYSLAADEDEYRLLLTFALIGLGLALAYTLLSIANTMLMATAARARDLGLLRRAGATPRQVLSSLTWESLVTVALGTGLGLLAGVAGLLGIRAGLARELDRQVALALPWFWIAVLVIAGTALASLAATLPACGSVRRPPSSTAREGLA